MPGLEVEINRGSMLQLYRAMWGPVYEAVLNILGGTGTVLPIGDPDHGQPDATTFKTVGDEQATFTWSEAPNSFDTKLDLTDPDGFQGIVPVVSLNGADEEADTPDATYWSRGDGSNDSPFSVGVWANMDANGNAFLAKYETTGGLREWGFRQTSAGKLEFDVYDESQAVSAFRLADAATSLNVWHFLVVTYDGAGGASAMDGVTFYEDGAVKASTATNNASYVAMENKTHNVEFAFYDGNGAFFDGKLAGGPLGPFFVQKALTADEVLRLHGLGNRALAV